MDPATYPSGPFEAPDQSEGASLLEWTEAIGNWHLATFGANVPNFRLGRKIVEEAEELRGELLDAELHQAYGSVGEELADVCIVAFAIASRAGIHLPNAILSKMEINAKRDWIEDEHGALFHTGIRFHRGGTDELRDNAAAIKALAEDGESND